MNINVEQLSSNNNSKTKSQNVTSKNNHNMCTSNRNSVVRGNKCTNTRNMNSCATCSKKITNTTLFKSCSNCSLDFHITCIDKSCSSNWWCNSCFFKLCYYELPFAGKMIDYDCFLGKGLKIAHVNIQSLRHKLDNLNIFLHSNNIDILCLTESWLSSDIDDSSIMIPGYNICRRDRTVLDREHGGGIVNYIKDGINYKDKTTELCNFNLDMLLIDIYLPNTRPILLSTVYRAPNVNVDYLKDVDNVFQNCSSFYNEMIIVGDFNLDISKPPNSKKINNFAKNSNLNQLIHDYTRINDKTKTIIDLAFVSRPETIIRSGVHSLGLSDHNLIYVVRKCKQIKLPPKITKSRSFKHFNEIDFLETLNSNNWNEVLNISDVNNAWSHWSNMFNSACNKHAPIIEKRIRGYLPEWVTSEFLQLSKDRDYYYGLAHKTNDPQDWVKAKALRNKVNNLNKSLKSKFFETEIQNNINDSSKLWKSIKKVIPHKQNKIGNVSSSDGYTNSDIDAANEFNAHFSSVGPKLASKFDGVQNDNNSNLCINTSENFTFHDISCQFVYEQICKMSNNKSSGIDDICTRLLKIASPVVCKSLAYICNLSLHMSVFPKDWKVAKVTPIHKSGDTGQVDNYRPISVLSIVSKIIERAVHDQLYSYFVAHNILSVCQSGFRKNHSTATTLLDVQDFILSNIDNGYVTAALFLDLKKAFDTVDHSLLIRKLNSTGIKGKELNWFVSYLNDRTQAVKIGNSLSTFRQVQVGVPQGSILGPLLFILYVNDLQMSVNCKIVMYADDTTLLFRSSDPASLQTHLDYNMEQISSWFFKNKLTLNIKKTKFMLFGTPPKLNKFSNVSLMFDNTIIEKVDSFKYLGLVFDSHMSWLNHVDYLKSTIAKRCGVIQRVKCYLPKHILKMLAEAMVMPHFDYCSPVWTNCNQELKTKMQRLQNRLARIILSADIRTPINDMMDLLHWLKLNDRWTNHMLIIIFKCLNGIAPNYLSSKFTFTNSIHNYSTRTQTSNNIVVPRSFSNTGMRTFHTRAAYLWNSLPRDVRLNFDSVSINQFKNTALIQVT